MSNKNKVFEGGSFKAKVGFTDLPVSGTTEIKSFRGKTSYTDPPVPSETTGQTNGTTSDTKK